jgi:hypothetical protein
MEARFREPILVSDFRRAHVLSSRRIAPGLLPEASDARTATTAGAAAVDSAGCKESWGNVEAISRTRRAHAFGVARRAIHRSLPYPEPFISTRCARRADECWRAGGLRTSPMRSKTALQVKGTVDDRRQHRCAAARQVDGAPRAIAMVSWQHEKRPDFVGTVLRRRVTSTRRPARARESSLHPVSALVTVSGAATRRKSSSTCGAAPDRAMRGLPRRLAAICSQPHSTEHC